MTAKAWKQLKCTLTDEWISQMRSVHISGYLFSLNKWKETPRHATSQLNLENIKLSKISQSPKKFMILPEMRSLESNS